MLKIKEYWQSIGGDPETTDPFERNEDKANCSISLYMCLHGIVSIIAIVLAIVGFFNVKTSGLYLIGLETILIIAPSIACLSLKGKGKAFKYILIVQFLLYSAVTRAYIGEFGLLLICVGVLMSSRYFNRGFTNIIIGIACIAFLSSEFGYCFGYTPDATIGGTTVKVLLNANGNGYTFEVADGKMWQYIALVWRYNGLPCGLLLILIFIITYSLTLAGRRLVDDKSKQLAKQAVISGELDMAKEIQKNMLPKSFPLFPEYEDINVYAIMNPAKEVGGDFYDAFTVDEDHVAFLIADVSGKGIPAAMFMALSKVIIKTQEIASVDPGKAFTAVNDTLREGNDINFFVTAWIGVMNTKTGELKYVNAGHNPPLFARKSGHYEFLRDISGPVLTALEGFPYKVHTLQLQKGDRLFLYTDGVTEAENAAHEQYGAKRLKDFLNATSKISIRSLVKEVECDVSKFVDGNTPSDDITILMFEYGTFSKSFYINKTSISTIVEICNRYMAKYGADKRSINQIDVVLDEALANIYQYAYEPDTEGTVTVSLNFEQETSEVTLALSDKGKPFNPLEKEEPDTTLSSKDRQIGGLGIYMVKKLADNIEYHRFGDENVLVITKKI